MSVVGRTRVWTHRGNYDLLNRDRISIQVFAEIVGFGKVSFLVDEERAVGFFGQKEFFYGLEDSESWAAYLCRAVELFIKRTLWGTGLDRVKALATFLEDEANLARIDLAWSDFRIERLTKQISDANAELAQMRKLRAEYAEACGDEAGGVA